MESQNGTVDQAMDRLTVPGSSTDPLDYRARARTAPGSTSALEGAAAHDDPDRGVG